MNKKKISKIIKIMCCMLICIAIPFSTSAANIIGNTYTLFNTDRYINLPPLPSYDGYQYAYIVLSVTVGIFNPYLILSKETVNFLDSTGYNDGEKFNITLPSNYILYKTSDKYNYKNNSNELTPYVEKLDDIQWLPLDNITSTNNMYFVWSNVDAQIGSYNFITYKPESVYGELTFIEKVVSFLPIMSTGLLGSGLEVFQKLNSSKYLPFILIGAGVSLISVMIYYFKGIRR